MLQESLRQRRYILAAAICLTALYLAQILLAVHYQTQTIDEGYHLAAGYRYWQCGDFGINPEHPPLVKFVAAAPLWWSRVPAPAGTCGSESTSKDAGYGRSAHWFYEQGLDPDRMLAYGRAAAALFSLVLALTCFFFGRALFGSVAALLGFIVLVFEPTLLAHGALITTDTAVAAGMVLSVFAFYRYADKPTARRLILTGLAVGLTLGTKHSGVLVLPVLLLLTIFETLRTFPRDGRAWVRALLSYAAIVAIAVVMLWSFYGFRFTPRPGRVPMSLPLAQFVTNVEQQGNHSFILTHAIPWIDRMHLLPQAYLYGFVDVLSISNPGQPPFLLGKLYPHGQWFYFPVTFIIKSTIGFLALCLLALLVRWGRVEWRRPLVYLLTPVIVIFGIAMTSGLNIGYRHILPIVPFLCMLLGATAAWMLSRGGTLRALAVLMLAAHVASSLHSFPDYIPYSNEAWGGPSRTYRVLTDANADWGQSIKELKTYLDGHGIRNCWLAYDGIASPHFYGIPCKLLPSGAWGAPGDDVIADVNGTLLISALTTSGIEWENADLNPYREFLKILPRDVIGGSILVFEGNYHLPEVAAVQQIAIANRALGENDFAKARDAAQAALTGMPESVRAYLALGNALVGLQEANQAREAFMNGLQVAQKRPEWYPNEMAEIRRRLGALTVPQ